MPTRKVKVKKKLQKKITAKFRRAGTKGNGKNNQDTKNWLKDPRTYKTKLCENFCKYGKCHHRSKCLFAHGVEELRPNPSLSKPSGPRPVMPPPPSLSTHQYYVMPPLPPGPPPSNVYTHPHSVMPPLPPGPPPPLSTSPCPGIPVSRRHRYPPSLPPSIYNVPCDIGSLQLSPPNSPKLLKFTNSPPAVHRPDPINVKSKLANYYNLPPKIYGGNKKHKKRT